jgi:hypothetical protein
VVDIDVEGFPDGGASLSTDYRFLIAEIAFSWSSFAFLAKPRSPYFAASRRCARAITKAAAVGNSRLRSLAFGERFATDWHSLSKRLGWSVTSAAWILDHRSTASRCRTFVVQTA